MGGRHDAYGGTRRARPFPGRRGVVEAQAAPGDFSLLRGDGQQRLGANRLPGRSQLQSLRAHVPTLGAAPASVG